MRIQAGVQFSLPLIDFTLLYVINYDSWGSVLITPDRLLLSLIEHDERLGFSSHYP